ncbi:hypothetical protein DES37_1095 [Mangrovibacter plantisponsor]|uniref:Uncharacterized protein n=1 Tax=Mangrovibacter plantisponsor TaxID=451513 RepID=A0A317PW29_9ENTR|nr:hypothetical protein DES37_1095 [Mangrovibacter plantisponsor]
MSSLHPEGENVSRLCAGSTAYVFKIYTDAFIRKVKYLLRMQCSVPGECGVGEYSAGYVQKGGRQRLKHACIRRTGGVWLQNNGLDKGL